MNVIISLMRLTALLLLISGCSRNASTLESNIGPDPSQISVGSPLIYPSDIETLPAPSEEDDFEHSKPYASLSNTIYAPDWIRRYFE